MNRGFNRVWKILVVLVLVLSLLGCDNSSSTKKREAVYKDKEVVLSLGDIPEYSGTPYVVINDNEPYFTEDEIVSKSYEKYSKLDKLGRCGVAMCCAGVDLMPTQKRGDIGRIKPTGWHSVQYDFVDGKSLYNRCHLIAFMISGEDDNEKNLITGTRYFNVQGMLPFEDMVADYVKETENHVMYRVTPLFEGKNLVAKGALMEAYSVEDEGEGVCFNVFCYNVQPGVKIDYATGENCLSDEELPVETTVNKVKETTEKSFETTKQNKVNSISTEDCDYVLNLNTKKFHLPDCPSVDEMSDENKGLYTGSRDDLLAEYSPCGRCHP